MLRNEIHGAKLEMHLLANLLLPFRADIVWHRSFGEILFNNLFTITTTCRPITKSYQEDMIAKPILLSELKTNMPPTNEIDYSFCL